MCVGVRYSSHCWLSASVQSWAVCVRVCLWRVSSEPLHPVMCFSLHWLSCQSQRVQRSSTRKALGRAEEFQDTGLSTRKTCRVAPPCDWISPSLLFTANISFFFYRTPYFKQHCSIMAKCEHLLWRSGCRVNLRSFDLYKSAASLVPLSSSMLGPGSLSPVCLHKICEEELLHAWSACVSCWDIQFILRTSPSWLVCVCVFNVCSTTGAGSGFLLYDRWISHLVLFM